MVKKFFRDHPVHKKIVPFFDYIFLFRPIYFLTVWLLIGAGMTVGQLSQNPDKIWGNMMTIDYTIFIFSITCIFSGCFIFWQKSTERGYPLQGSASFLKIKSQFLFNKNLYLGLFLLGLIGIGIINIFLIIPCILIIFIVGPPRLSNAEKLTQFELILSGGLLIFTSHLFMIYEIHINQFDLSAIKLIIPYIFILISISILLPIERYANTKSIDEKIEVTKLSDFRLKFIVTSIICLFTIIIGFSFNDPVSSTAALTLLPFLVVLSIRCNRVDLVRAVRYSILIISVYIFSVFPGFIWYSIGIYANIIIGIVLI